MVEDSELLGRYVKDRSEPAFTELVQRHIDLVYSVAVRQVGGDAHLAEDVVQKVFSALAHKAVALMDRSALGGWLYRSAQFEASKVVRSERRRRRREEAASTWETIMRTPAAETNWEKLRPVLDQTMAELGEADRDAIVLRFVEDRGFAEVGERMQLSENAARMRVNRALDKLQSLLARRGVTSTTTALSVAMAGQAGMAAPAGLAVSVAGGIASGTVLSGSIAAGIFMGMTKLNLGLIGALIIAGGAGVALQQKSKAAWQREQAEQQQQVSEVADLHTVNEKLQHIVQEIEALRNDDAELARLRKKAMTLRAKTVADPAGTVDKGLGFIASTVYDSKRLDVQPKPTFQSAPTYPKELRQAGVTGQALVSFVVQGDGSLSEVQVVNATHPEFGVAAQEAVKKWRFAPGQIAGTPVNALMKIPIVFGISSEKKSAPVEWF